MTIMPETVVPTDAAVAIIDAALPSTATRELIPADEVQALLLDIRNAITSTN